jgi:hypothetical protein
LACIGAAPLRVGRPRRGPARPGPSSPHVPTTIRVPAPGTWSNWS